MKDTGERRSEHGVKSSPELYVMELLQILQGTLHLDDNAGSGEESRPTMHHHVVA